MTVYNCHTIDGAYHMTKFDENMDVEATYELSLTECACPAGVRPTCRHRKMLPLFMANDAIDTNKFYCYETHQWSTVAGLDDEIEVTTIEATPEPAPPPPPPPPESIRRRF